MIEHQPNKTALRFSMPVKTVFLTILLALAPVAVSAQDKAPWERKALIETLQKGGYVLIIRHERTNVPSRYDDYTKAPNDCRAQRNLSVAGAAGAKETGIILAALNINVDLVISSPMCRSAETARYMFGENYKTEIRAMHEDPYGERKIDIAVVEFKEFLSELAEDSSKSNIAIVGHGNVIYKTIGLGLSEGEIGVLKFEDDGNIKVVDQFLGSDLSYFARAALKKQGK